ncbi:MAG: hypothetical protein ACK4NX_03245, partial [Candidatus Paceibacteria bacterium]
MAELTATATPGSKLIGTITIPPEVVLTVQQEVANLEGFRKIIKLSLYKNISELAEMMLAGAVALNVSDLHLEPEEKQTKLR